MTRRLIVLLVLAAAAAALVAAPASATTPPPQPPQPPTAYVQVSTYSNGCSGWSLRSNYPMSTTDPKWVFTCVNVWADDGFYYGETDDSYYWNANLGQAILFDQQVWDNTGWWNDCTLYPVFIGACPA